MFDRFDDQARKVMVSSQDVARHDRASGITADHIARAVLSGPGTTAAQALSVLGVDRRVVLAAVDGVLVRGPGPAPTERIPFTPQAKGVLAAAAEGAQGLGDGHIGSEHLLLGLVAEGTSPSSQVLVAHGASPPALRDAIARVPGRGAPAGVASAPPAASDRAGRRRWGRASEVGPSSAERPGPQAPVAGAEAQDPSLGPRLAAHLRALWDAGRHDEVLAEAERLLAPGQAPVDARAMVGLYAALAVVTLPRPERYPEADGWLEGALGQPATRSLALHLRGRMLAAQGRRAEAAQVFDGARAEVAPGDPQGVRLWVSRLSVATDAADADRLLDGIDDQLRVAVSERDRVSVLVVAASAIALDLMAERFGAAEAMVAEAAALAPDDSSAQVVRWLLWAVTGRGADAIDGLRGSLAPDPALPDHVLGARHAGLARALLDTGDEAGARHHAGEAQRLGAHRPLLADVWRRLDEAAGTWLPPS